MIGPAIEGPCRDVDPDLFFGDTKAEIKKAKAICATCPVQNRIPCLNWAIEMDVRFGVFGGLTPSERGRAA